MHTNDCPQTRSLLSLSVGGWVRTLVASAVIVAVPSTFAQDTAAGTTKSTDSAPERAPGTSTANATTTPSAPAENVPADNVPASTDRPQIHKAIGAADPLVQSFNEHLTILASPWMEGRLPGTRGMERAMEYMEDQFRQAGLEPAYQPAEGGSKTYRQPFSLGGKREVVEERIMALCGGGEIAFTAGTDFKLTSLGKSGSTEGEIAFVGYGIEDGPEGYSSFAEGHSLEGKIALVFRFEPMNEKGKSLWSEGEGWSGRAGFAGKIGAVAKRKPAAIIVVNTPGADDPRIDSLTTAGGGRAMADAPVFMMSTAAAEKLVSACDGKRSLMDLRKLADNPPADQPKSFDLTGSKVSIAGLIEEKPVRAENIVGVLPGRGALAKEVIVIGGHLDHLGQGDFGSREGPGKLHPGADDNASGSAGVILLGDLLKKEYDALPAETPLRTIVFIGFSAEESGLNGSRYYVDNPIYPIKDTVLMMNFDMIGRIKDGRLSVTESKAKGMQEWAAPIYAKSPLTIVRGERSGGGSDHASFQQAGVPILFAIIADFHDDYHTSRDVSELIDREASVEAIKLWHALASDMARRPERFELDTAAGPMRAQPMRVRAGMRTRELEDGGLEVVDVTKDGSAEKAGIQKGDRIIKWNKKDITTRAEFVDELRTHEVGDKVQAVFIRNGEEKTVYVEMQGATNSQ